MKIGIYSVIGVFGAAFASFFGGWSSGLTTLIIFMAVDYFSGLIVAGFFIIQKYCFWNIGKSYWVERFMQGSIVANVPMQIPHL